MKYAKTLKHFHDSQRNWKPAKANVHQEGGAWENLHMHTHQLLKLLKLLATSTKLSHTYTILKDMEETTFQSALKQKKAMFLFSTFVRNSVKT